MHALACAFVRTLNLIHDEWTLFCGKDFGGFDGFVAEMNRLSLGEPLGQEFGFLHPHLVSTPRAFGNYWTI